MTIKGSTSTNPSLIQLDVGTSSHDEAHEMLHALLWQDPFNTKMGASENRHAAYGGLFTYGHFGLNGEILGLENISIGNVNKILDYAPKTYDQENVIIPKPRRPSAPVFDNKKDANQDANQDSN